MATLHKGMFKHQSKEYVWNELSAGNYLYLEQKNYAGGGYLGLRNINSDVSICTPQIDEIAVAKYLTENT